MNRPGGRKRRPRLAGTNLCIDPRTGNYLWRRTDETTGRRIKRSTKTPSLTIALKIAAQFEDDYQKKRAGLTVYDAWKKSLRPMAEEWVASLKCTTRVHDQLESQIYRAIELLGLSTPADLENIPRLERALLSLERTEERPDGFPRMTLRRGFQKPLKQFSRWLASNRRHLDRDPLRDWTTLEVSDPPRRERRAFRPEEVARALICADYLDTAHGREHPLRVVFTSLLITGSRVGALIERGVESLDREKSRIQLGEDVGKKHRGEAALDARTLAEVTVHVGKRASGPLFPSPDGKTLDRLNLVDDWKESFGLGLVRELWPRDETPDAELAWLVTRALITGRASVPNVGNPGLVLDDTRRNRAAREADVRRLADLLRDTWRARMRGVDVHALRKTHRTWAEARGVHPILIDKQLGHSTPAGASAIEAARSLLSSPTGRKHYVDMGLTLLDARRSAEAVRELLDDAFRTVKRQDKAWFAGHRLVHGENQASESHRAALP